MVIQDLRDKIKNGSFQAHTAGAPPIIFFRIGSLRRVEL